MFNRAPNAIEPRSLYELVWAYAPGAMFAFDAISGNLIDVNPASEVLSGYSHEELLGLNIALMHPEVERERVQAEFVKAGQKPSDHVGYHIQRKDGRSLPVAISLSKSVALGGQPVVIGVYSDLTEFEQREHRLSTKRGRCQPTRAQPWRCGKSTLPRAF